MWSVLTSGRYGYLADYLVWTVLLLSVTANAVLFLRFARRNQQSRRRLIVGNLLVLASLLSAVAWIGETYFRFIRISTDSFGVTLPAQRWFQRYVVLNSWGCRDREWLPTPPANVRRVLVLGDSFAWGWGVERVEDRVGERLAVGLRQVWRAPVECMTLAQPGWDTGDQLEPLRAALDAFRVDEVILIHVPNDIERLLPVRRDFDPKRPPRCTWFNTDASAFFEHLYYHVYLPRVPTVSGFHDWLADGYADPGTWTAQQERLRALVETCRAKQIPFRVALFPFLRTGGRRFDGERIARIHAAFFESIGVPVVDLRPALGTRPAGELIVSTRDAHPNAEAHAIAADALLDAFYARPATGDP
ncbi:MAG: hypothetical protein BroJett003_02500 [Planctomycetota bacterium]|nr:MAG: hypothetical protein BroJett003_02500 [Planctomycetota bacterium]